MENRDYTGRVEKLPRWQKDLCRYVMEEADRGKEHFGGMEDLYQDLYDMFRGERPEKKYDYESNVVLRKAFQIVWKAVSYITQKINGATPIVGVEGFNKRGCLQREVLLDKWYCKNRYFIKLVLGCLGLLLYGQCFIKKTMVQEFQEINGRMIPVKDYPEDTILNNRNVITDWLLPPGKPAQEGRFFIHREVIGLDELYSSKIDYINLDIVDDMLEDRGQKTTDSQTGVNLSTSKDQLNDPPDSQFYRPVEIYERQGKMPVRRGKDGKDEPVFDLRKIGENEKIEYKQMVVSIANLDIPVLIRFEENPYKEINIINPQLFLDPDRWPAMGMVEPVADMITAIQDNLNMAFDRKNIEAMPPVIFDKFAQVDWDTIVHAPGQKWSVENPQETVVFPSLPPVPQDVWITHDMLSREVDLTSSVTPTFQGMDKSNTATQGVLNSQFSIEKMDLIVQLIEFTWLRPGAQMSIRFAQKFSSPLTFLMTLGEPFNFDIWEEEYQYEPKAAAVKLDQQKEVEIQQDIQLIQILSTVPNPNTAQVLNYFIGHILRNRNEPKIAALFDEQFGAQQAARNPEKETINGIRTGNAPPSNQNGLAMSQSERSVRNQVSPPAGLMRS